MTDDSKSSGETGGTAPLANQTETKSDTPKISFADLAKGHRIVRIVHGESVYELRLTRNGRLILSK